MRKSLLSTSAAIALLALVGCSSEEEKPKAESAPAATEQPAATTEAPAENAVEPETNVVKDAVEETVNEVTVIIILKNYYA